MSLPLVLVVSAALLLVATVVVAVVMLRASARMGSLEERMERIETRLDEGLHRSMETFSGMLDSNLSNLRGELHSALENTRRSMDAGIRQAADAVKEVGEKLVRVEEFGKRVYEVGKSISSLENILKAPKLRGGFGEYLLENLLKEVLPAEVLDFQYKMPSGERVDAVIRLEDGMIPVDSKFPLERFRDLLEATSDDERAAARKKLLADVKKHIDSIASKYIRPDAGTYDFAVMYIPSESVYYEVFVEGTKGESLLEYAVPRRVIPASPSTLFAYLQAILLGLRGMKVQRAVREIIDGMSAAEKEMQQAMEVLEKMYTHQRNAVKAAESLRAGLEKLRSRLQVPWEEV